jgi:thiol-disulfide isomerase/thioredoxin
MTGVPQWPRQNFRPPFPYLIAMTPDDVLSFLFDHHTIIFGIAIVVAFAVIVKIGRPRRWWGWLFDAGSVGAIVVSAVALWFFTGVAGAMDHRLESLTFTHAGDPTPHKLSEYRGKVVFLNYWATWCGPCRHEIPAINKLAERYRGTDVVFLAVTDEDFAVIDKFRTQFPMRATVARFTSEEPRTGIEKMVYGGRPTTIVIDRDGRVHTRIIGAKSFEDFDATLTSVSRVATSRAALQ